MEEILNGIEMIYIQNTSGDNYSVECIGRHHQTTKLNFSDVEGIEVNAVSSVEIKQSFIQLSEEQGKMWNIKFTYPEKIAIKYLGKILIEVG